MSMEQRIDAFDWASTPIGPRSSWPQSLRTSLSICLASRFPILIWWGPELIKLYNDAYAPILGSKHPGALGARGREVWPEIWPVIGPMLDQVMHKGKATWSDDQLLLMRRHGYIEESYFTFSYSPIVDESGGIGGIFTAVFETTSRVIGERRLDTLRKLAARASDAQTVEEACRNALEILGENPKDVPLAAIRMRGSDDVPPPNALELPLFDGTSAEPIATLVAKASDQRPFDDDYRGFFSLVAGHISSAITKAKAYEAERMRAEALAELDRAKTAFFSNVSHEFRTPLTLMLGPLEDVLGGGDALDRSTRDQLEVAHRNALRLLKLVNNLLDFSRMEAGRVEASYEPVDLAALTTDLAGVFRSAVERAGLQLVVECAPLSQPVFVDRQMWEKIVLNLLSNAFKFTFDGAITVSLRESGDHAELSVRDTGTGIPESELPHVFDRFHRVHGAHGRTHEGSGIGLALVHELVQLHGGSVGATSELDRGSTFTVSIPFGSEHLPADRINAQRSRTSTAIGGDAFVEEALRWLPEAKEQPVSTGDRARIVVADDNADMRSYLGRLLGPRYDVELVADGRAALAAIERELPDLVLADVMMPEVDGFELLRALRSGEQTRELPVVLLSARAGEEAQVEGLDAGADDYLIKPFNARELLARVEAHVRLNRVRRGAGEVLRASETRFSTAFSRSPLPLVIASLDDERLLDMNDAFLRFVGYSREEMLVQPTASLWVRPELRSERLAQLRKGLEVPDAEMLFRTKSGEERIAFVSSAAVEINGGPCVLSSVVDVTDRRRAEEAIRLSEHRFREFADTAPAMLSISDASGDCTFLSRGWYEFSGQTEEEALGFGWVNALHPDDRQPTRDALLEANARQQAFSVDHRVLHVDGTYHWVSATGRPRFGPDGAFLGYIGSLIDINDRKHAEQAKDEFLASLSHELRTPLTSGFGWVKLLGRTRDDELLETGLRAIDESFVNQMRLVDDLLDISRIAAGKLHLEIQSLDLRGIVDAALDMVRPSAAAKQIALSAELAPVLLVRGDAARLKQVFWNLLTNAIKFTPAGGSVEVVLRRNGLNAEVVVRDHGEGIRKEFLPHVFDRFRQADATTTRRHGGLGIGLSIVSSLVDAHRGTVRAESDGLGTGATFTVVLPLLDADTLVAPLPALVRDDASTLDGSRILVVDDDDGARQIMTTVLLAAGADVRNCSSAHEAFAAIEQWQPHILVSDLAMPNEDGYSLIRRLRDSGNALPALAITAYARPEDEAAVLQAGFQKHVAKPFDPQELVRILRDLR